MSEKITKYGIRRQRLYFNSTISNLRKTCGKKASNTEPAGIRKKTGLYIYLNKDLAAEYFEEDLHQLWQLPQLLDLFDSLR
jgi:hypothetical protein